MTQPPDALIEALRKMPVPAPRPGFAERALAQATRAGRRAAQDSAPAPTRSGNWLPAAWFAAALGTALAAGLTLFFLRPIAHNTADEPGLVLALNEMRDIDVLIQSERDLKDATIHIAVSGGVALDGYDDEHEIGWQTDLKRGSNVLSLPVVARAAGSGRLVAVIEHEGKIRRMTVDLTVSDQTGARS